MRFPMPVPTALRGRAPLLAALLVLCSCAGRAAAQPEKPVRALIVTAHPDDEAMFAAAIYQITHALGGAVDLALVTDGSGGYRYATLAEPIYHLRLTDEAVARKALPAIRKRELMEGGSIIGIRNYFFLDELDHRYTLNVDSVLAYVWDTDAVQKRLGKILAKGSYDFVITHLPIPQTHGHHKGATIMALEAVAKMDPAERPVVLGSFISSKADTSALAFTELPGYPLTRIRTDVPPFTFDRTTSFGAKGRLNYKIIVNWLIAAHKSQGTMQLLMNRGDLENFWIFALDVPNAVARTRALFENLRTTSHAGKPASR
ncbi:PIG-L family deacetylase [Rhodocaloribacter sp.]